MLSSQPVALAFSQAVRPSNYSPSMSDGASPFAATVSVERVASALGAAGAHATIRWLDGSARTAAAAAEQLQVSPAQIANSLVFTADDEPVLVLASGGHRVDVQKLAALLHATSVRRASPEIVRAATGFAIGGVAPVGHPAPLRTVVDSALARYDVVWAAAGHPHAVFPTTYAQLLTLTSGTPADVGADP